MVMLKTNTQTIELDGSEQEVRFNRNYPYFWVQNQGDGDVLISINSGIAEGKDGVITILGGGGTGCTMHGYDLDRFYLLGSGKVQVVGTYSAHCPFKSALKGGVSTASGAASYTLNNAVDYPLIGLNLYGKSTQDGTPTPENPVEIVSVGDSGSVVVQACGKNLFPWNDYTKIPNIWFKVESGEKTTNEIKFVSIKDILSIFSIPSPNIKGIMSSYNGQTVTISAEIKSDAQVPMTFGLQSNFKRFLSTNNWQKISHTFNYCNADWFDASLIIGVEGGAATIYSRNISIELGDTATDYAPYKGNTANITSALPLCGIPVESGGNYTDKNGQQWVCDELIYNADGTGKIVKRCDKTKLTSANITSFVEHKTLGNYFFTNVKSINVDDQSSLIPISNAFKGIKFGDRANSDYLNKFRCFISSDGRIMLRNSAAENDKFSSLDDMKNFVDTNDVYVIYPIAEPQEIELTAAEMSALSQLQTFEGVTNISNSGGADMGVKYCTNKMLSKCVMPVVSGMQKQIDDLKSAVLSLGGNV